MYCLLLALLAEHKWKEGDNKKWKPWEMKGKVIKETFAQVLLIFWASHLSRKDAQREGEAKKTAKSKIIHKISEIICFVDFMRLVWVTALVIIVWGFN